MMLLLSFSVDRIKVPFPVPGITWGRARWMPEGTGTRCL